MDDKEVFYKKFRGELIKHAEAGNAKAQCILGLLYIGLLAPGTEALKDPVEGVKWLRLSAEQGVVRAQRALAKYLAEGDGIEKDRAGAMEWWRRAAEQGDAESHFHLAERLVEDCRREEAFRWFSKGAGLGDGNCMARIASAYEYGRGVEIDLKEAFKWRLKTEEHCPSSNAWFNLGRCYEHGIGTEPDLRQALKYYHRAADLNNHAAAIESLKRLGRPIPAPPR